MCRSSKVLSGRSGSPRGQRILLSMRFVPLRLIQDLAIWFWRARELVTPLRNRTFRRQQKKYKEKIGGRQVKDGALWGFCWEGKGSYMEGYLAKLSLVFIRIQDRKWVWLKFRLQADFHPLADHLCYTKGNSTVGKCHNIINLLEAGKPAPLHTELHGDGWPPNQCASSGNPLMLSTSCTNFSK